MIYLTRAKRMALTILYYCTYTPNFHLYYCAIGAQLETRQSRCEHITDEEMRAECRLWPLFEFFQVIK